MAKSGLSFKSIAALFLVFAGLAFATAYGTNSPSIFGHSAGEIDFSGFSGNIATPGSIQANTICIGTDCRTSWPTSSSSGTGSPSIIFQAQRFIDDDTNYYIDLNAGANIAGNWNLNGQFKADTICIGTDCRTSWPTSSSGSVNVITTTVSAVNSGSGKSVAADGETQWMITGGHRYCVSQGYQTGMVVEYGSNNPSDTAVVSCFN